MNISQTDISIRMQRHPYPVRGSDAQSGIERCCRIDPPHTGRGTYIALWGLCMLHLVQQPRWNRAIKHQVSLEQLDLLHRLPPLDGGRARCGLWFVVEWVLGLKMLVVARGVLVVIERGVWIRPKGGPAADHGPPVVILPVVVWLGAIRVWAFVVRRGVVRRIVVGIVVRLGVERVAAVLAVGRARGVVVVVVAGGVWHVLDGILCACGQLPMLNLQAHETYTWLQCQSVGGCAWAGSWAHGDL